jgi:hypothetical protein
MSSLACFEKVQLSCFGGTQLVAAGPAPRRAPYSGRRTAERARESQIVYREIHGAFRLICQTEALALFCGAQ